MLNILCLQWKASKVDLDALEIWRKWNCKKLSQKIRFEVGMSERQFKILNGGYLKSLLDLFHWSEFFERSGPIRVELESCRVNFEKIVFSVFIEDKDQTGKGEEKNDER